MSFALRYHSWSPQSFLPFGASPISANGSHCRSRVLRRYLAMASPARQLHVLREEAIRSREIRDLVLAPRHAVALVGDQHVLHGHLALAQRCDDLIGLVLRRDRIADALIDEHR